MFFKLEQDLSPLLLGVGCNAKAPLSVEYKLAAFLLRVSSGDTFKMISELLGIGRTTAIWHCWMVAQAIVQVYKSLVNKANYERSLNDIQNQFHVEGHVSQDRT